MSHSALGPQHHEQLAMFYTPGQIRSRWSMLPADRDHYEADQRRYHEEYADEGEGRDFDQHPYTDKEAWDEVADQAMTSHLIDDVEENGVHSPVLLGPKYIQDGHHRIASAKPEQLIPAEHTDDPNARRRGGKTVSIRLDEDQQAHT